MQLLIAAPGTVIQMLAAGLGDLPVELHRGRTVLEAEGELARKLDLVMVCYVFDNLRPYRFIRRIREDAINARTPVILVRALPVPLGRSEEKELEQAYKSIGINAFLNYSQLLKELDPAQADEALRRSVLKLVRLSATSGRRRGERRKSPSAR